MALGSTVVPQLGPVVCSCKVSHPKDARDNPDPPPRQLPGLRASVLRALAFSTQKRTLQGVRVTQEPKNPQNWNHILTLPRASSGSLKKVTQVRTSFSSPRKWE